MAEIDVYPAQPHPNRQEYNRARNIVENDHFSVAQKKAKLESIGFFYRGVTVLNAAVFTHADNIITSTTLSDQQKINQLHAMGFDYMPRATTTLPAATTTATATQTGIPLWMWVAGGAALLMIIK